jgi:hypothetical protein
MILQRCRTGQLPAHEDVNDAHRGLTGWTDIGRIRRLIGVSTVPGPIPTGSDLATHNQNPKTFVWTKSVDAIMAQMNGTKLRRLFLCRAEFIRPLAVGGYPHSGYIRDDRWYGNVVGRMNSTLQWVK